MAARRTDDALQAWESRLRPDILKPISNILLNVKTKAASRFSDDLHSIVSNLDRTRASPKHIAKATRFNIDGMDR